MTWGESLAPLQERRFRFFFASRAVNIWGTTMAPVALAFAVLAVEDSAAALGQVLAARSIPMVLFLLLGGVGGCSGRGSAYSQGQWPIVAALTYWKRNGTGCSYLAR